MDNQIKKSVLKMVAEIEMLTEKGNREDLLWKLWQLKGVLSELEIDIKTK